MKEPKIALTLGATWGCLWKQISHHRLLKVSLVKKNVFVSMISLSLHPAELFCYFGAFLNVTIWQLLWPIRDVCLSVHWQHTVYVCNLLTKHATVSWYTSNTVVTKILTSHLPCPSFEAICVWTQSNGPLLAIRKNADLKHLCSGFNFETLKLCPNFF